MATHNEVCHAWAHQTGKNRKGHNMFYEGPTIFSYGHHFPIARIVTNERGEQAVLLTTDTYSVSTSKHITYTWRACSHMLTFSVPFVDHRGSASDNARAYIVRIVDYLEKAKRARVYKDSHMRSAERLTQEARDFIAFFDVPGYEDFNWAPEAMVEGLRIATQRQQQAEREAARIREAAKRRRYREEVWPKIKEWLRGETNETYWHTPRPLPRIQDGFVVTSWGARAPLPIAKRLYWKAIQCRREHKAWVPEKGLLAGDFEVRHITKSGDLVVGCHNIPFWFMHYAARRNDIPPVPPLAIAA